MAETFQQGEADADSPAPAIAQETMGAMYGVQVRRPAMSTPREIQEPYLMQSVHARNGSMERTMPSIVLTPLGGMMPGPNAIAPAVPVGAAGAGYDLPEGTMFGAGVRDAWPDGSPVPVR